MAQALILAIGGVLTAVLNLLSGGNLKQWIPWFTQRLLRLATRRLPETQQDRFAEEWTSHMNDVPGDVRRVLFAWGCVSAARDMSSFLTDHKANLGRFWKPTADLFRALTRSLSDASLAVVVFLEDIILQNGGIMRTIAVGALVGPLVGFLISYFVPPKYTSQSVILIERQRVPETIVQPVVSDDLQTRFQMLTRIATSDSEMRPALTALFPTRSSRQIDAMLDGMRSQVDLIAPFSDLSQISGSNVEKKPGQQTSPGFFVSYTAPNPREAQQVCEALTSKIIAQNLKFILDNAKGTVDVISEGLAMARSQVMAASAKLDAAKKVGHGEEILATIDFETAKHQYQELLEDMAKADMTANMTRQAQGERMNEIEPASFPDSQDSPNRLLFAGGGLAGGIVAGLGLTIWTRLRGRSLGPGTNLGIQAGHFRSTKKDIPADDEPGTQSENTVDHTNLLDEARREQVSVTDRRA